MAKRLTFGLILVAGIVLLSTAAWRRLHRTSSDSPAPQQADRAPALPTFSSSAEPSADRGWQLDIDVTDAGTGEVRGAHVTVSRVPSNGLSDHGIVSGLIIGECISDQRGQCRIQNVAPGRYVVSAVAERLLPASAVVNVSAPVKTKLVMAPGGFVVSGVVVELSGSPVPEAELLIYSRKPGAFLVRTTAARDGRFAVSLNAGPVALSASAAGYSTDAKQLVLVRDTTGVVLRLSPAAASTFRVTAGASDEPAAGAVLVIRRQAPILSTVETVRVDDRGVGQARLAPGNYVLEARHRQGSARQNLTIKLGDSSEHEVHLTKGLTLGGEFVGSGEGVNGPIRGATVTLTNDRVESWKTSTGTDGRFEVSGLLPGAYHVSAVSGQIGRADTDVTLTDGDQTVVLTAREARLDGLVVDSHGAPIAGARVTVFRSWQNRPGEKEQSGLASGDGRFSLKVSPGTFVVEAAAPQGRGQSDRVVVPGSGPVTVRVEPQRLIQGTVEWSSGGPAPGIQVETSTEGTNSGERTMTDDGGRFRLGPFPSGSRIRLVASAPSMNGVTTIKRMTKKRGPDGEWRTVSIESDNARFLLVGTDETDNVLLRVDRGTEQISGRVVRRDGRPVVGAQVAAIPGGASAAVVGILPDAVTTDQNGTFRLERLPRGEYSIVTEMEESPRVIVPRVATGGRDVTVVLDIARQ